MRIIKDRRIVEDDWQILDSLASETQLPEGDVIVPFADWLIQQARLSEHTGRVAICVNGDDALEEVAKYLERFDLIALLFPVFTDGRAYSVARLLRSRYHFKGELRAIGNVLRDQLFFMERCGINAFCLSEGKDMEDALSAFTEFSVKYQATADDDQPLYRYR